MAFDMYIGDKREKIDHHEEYIFDLIENSKNSYPQLGRIYSNFYTDFVISPDQANQLILELLQLESEAQDKNKSFQLLILRLVSFFALSVREKKDISCTGD